MKFPNILNIKDYSELLRQNACEVKIAENTGVYAEYVDLYLDMLNKQLTYDALKLIAFDIATMERMGKKILFRSPYIPATWQSNTAVNIYQDELIRLSQFLIDLGGNEQDFSLISSPTPSNSIPENISEKRLQQANKIRKMLQELRTLVFKGQGILLPALEMLIAEMLAIHCAFEGKIISRKVKEMGIPVTEIEIPPMADVVMMNIKTKIQALIEIAGTKD